MARIEFGACVTDPGVCGFHSFGQEAKLLGVFDLHVCNAAAERYYQQ
jgi:hypothetical protein